MARCDACKQEMLTATHCAANHKIRFPDGERLRAIPFGEEQNIPFNRDEREHVHCGDCNVRPGARHHPGCDMEECPRCHGQRISCECLAEGDGREDSLKGQLITHPPRNSRRLLARVAEDGSNRIEVGRFSGDEFEHLYVLKRPRAFELLFSLLGSLEITMSASIPSPEGDRRYQAVCLKRMELVYSEGASIGATEEFLIQLLTEARHLCDAQTLEFGAIDRKAYTRYLTERLSSAQSAP